MSCHGLEASINSSMKEASSEYTDDSRKHRSSRVNSYIVSVCILFSRIAGLLREILLAHFLGTTVYSDAFKAALRIPNILQNLFGEGVLSASFIPVYVRLRKEERYEEARLLAKECAFLLILVGLLAASLGVIFSDEIVRVLTPGFHGETFKLTSNLLKILFPGTALLMVSAWCLGILNSHRYFALSYSAPVFWNLSIICGLLLLLLPYADTYSMEETINHISYFVLVGCALQLGVQIPKTFALIKSKTTKTEKKKTVRSLKDKNLSFATNEVVRGFVPVSLGRGVIQISAYLDTIIASLLQSGSLSVLMYAQSIFLLPVSIFGMAISAAELPELSENRDSIIKDQGAKDAFIKRIHEAKTRVLFFILPSAIVFLCFGFSIIEIVFKSGNFNVDSVMQVATMLGILSLALVPSTLSRITSSSLYALSYHTLVSKISIFRLFLGSLVGACTALLLLPYLGIAQEFHVLGLGAGTVLGSWLELFLLDSLLKKKGNITTKFFGPSSLVIPIVVSAIVAVIPSFLIRLLIGDSSRLLQTFPLLVYMLSYVLLCWLLNVKELRDLVSSLAKRFKYRSS